MYENKIIKSGYVKWKELIPFQNENFKEMSKDEFAKLEKSFEKNGSLMAWTIWENKDKKYLLDGVGRKLLYEEKEKQGLKPPDKVYCNYLDLKNKKEAAKAVLILSSQYRRITEEGLLEFTTLNDLYSELPELSAEIDLANFDMPNYLESNYEGEPEKDLDEVPAIPKKALSKLGDLFEIDGKHRVLCGDLTNQENINFLLGKAKPEICIADPPYELDEKTTIEMIKIMENNTSGNFFIMATDSLCKIILKNTQLKFRGFLVCLLNISLPQFGYFYRKHIQILHFYNGKMNWVNAQKSYNTVFDMREYRQHTENSKLHIHSKPINLFTVFMESFKCESVLDLFSGSGSTLISAEENKKSCYSIELEPLFVDTILKRYKNTYKDSKFKCLNRKFDFDKLFSDLS